MLLVALAADKLELSELGDAQVVRNVPDCCENNLEDTATNKLIRQLFKPALSFEIIFLNYQIKGLFGGRTSAREDLDVGLASAAGPLGSIEV